MLVWDPGHLPCLLRKGARGTWQGMSVCDGTVSRLPAQGTGPRVKDQLCPLGREPMSRTCHPHELSGPHNCSPPGVVPDLTRGLGRARLGGRHKTLGTQDRHPQRRTPNSHVCKGMHSTCMFTHTTYIRAFTHIPPTQEQTLTHTFTQVRTFHTCEHSCAHPYMSPACNQATRSLACEHTHVLGVVGD